MATATPSRLALAAALAAVLALAGCGGAARPSVSHPAAARPGAFTWLQPAAVPAGWTVRRLPSRQAELAYPPGWRPITTDPGTFSAALLGPHGRIRGYLNATPRSGEETLANWAAFRPAHNREEGDRHVVGDASAVGLRFRSATGSCVIDHYTTSTSARYREIACIVRGARATTVVVGAALPADWTRLAPQLRQSIASFSS
jgi:hypothetical protein